MLYLNSSFNYKISKDLKKRKVFSESEYNGRLLKSIIYNNDVSRSTRMGQILKLHSICRLKSHTKIRNRCVFTGRPISVIRDFKVNRHMFRYLSGEGLFPGLIKSSW